MKLIDAAEPLVEFFDLAETPEQCADVFCFSVGFAIGELKRRKVEALKNEDASIASEYDRWIKALEAGFEAFLEAR